MVSTLNSEGAKTIETGFRQLTSQVEQSLTHVDHGGSVPNVGLLKRIPPSLCGFEYTARSDGPIPVNDERPKGHDARAPLVIAREEPRGYDRDPKSSAPQLVDKVPRFRIVFIEAQWIEGRHAVNVEILELDLVNAEFFAQPDEVRHECQVVFRTDETRPDDPREAARKAPATEFLYALYHVVKQGWRSSGEVGKGLRVVAIEADIDELERHFQESVKLAGQEGPIRNQMGLDSALASKPDHRGKVGVQEGLTTCEIDGDGPRITVEELPEHLEVHIPVGRPLAVGAGTRDQTVTTVQIAAHGDTEYYPERVIR